MINVGHGDQMSVIIMGPGLLRKCRQCGISGLGPWQALRDGLKLITTHRQVIFMTSSCREPCSRGAGWAVGIPQLPCYLRRATPYLPCPIWLT